MNKEYNSKEPMYITSLVIACICLLILVTMLVINQSKAIASKQSTLIKPIQEVLYLDEFFCLNINSNGGFKGWRKYKTTGYVNITKHGVVQFRDITSGLTTTLINKECKFWSYDEKLK